DPAAAMLAGEEPALTVAGVAVRVVARAAMDRHLAVDVAQQPVVGDVAPDEDPGIGEVDGPLPELGAGEELLALRPEQDAAPEQILMDLEKLLHRPPPSSPFLAISSYGDISSYRVAGSQESSPAIRF